MPREKEGYRDTLERVRQLNKERNGGALIMSRKQAAAIVGVSETTLYRMGFGRYITCEQLARAFC